MRSLACCLAPLLLFGCASTTPPPSASGKFITKEKVITERGHTIDWLTPRSDVVGIEPGYRHTLGFEPRYHRLTAAEKRVVGDVKKTRQPKQIASNNGQAKDIWSRFCSGEPLTEDEYKKVGLETPPGKWAEPGKCLPAK